MEQELLTVKQASDETGISWQAIYRAIKDGRLQAMKIGKLTLIRRADLDAWEPRKPKRPPPEKR